MPGYLLSSSSQNRENTEAWGFQLSIRRLIQRTPVIGFNVDEYFMLGDNSLASQDSRY